jgi:hypothetical protein
MMEQIVAGPSSVELIHHDLVLAVRRNPNFVAEELLLIVLNTGDDAREAVFQMVDWLLGDDAR